MTQAGVLLNRRRLIKSAAAAATLVAMGAQWQAAKASAPINIGYWPVASSLPFFVAIEKGYFTEQGLSVNPVRMASPQQIIEAMVAGRLDGSANGTASASLAIGETVSPGLLKIICANPSNRHYVLDEVLVPESSTVSSIEELAGKRFASGPGIQNVTLAKVILERNGIANPTIIELPVGQHVPALMAGQVDGVYTLEPSGTLGVHRGGARILETGVVSRYALGDEDAPWFGGAASLLSSLIESRPEDAEKYITAYAKAVDDVRERPDEVRQYLVGYTGITEDIVDSVPMTDYVMYDEFSDTDIDAFQRFYDLFEQRGILKRHVDVATLIYAGKAENG